MILKLKTNPGPGQNLMHRESVRRHKIVFKILGISFGVHVIYVIFPDGMFLICFVVISSTLNDLSNA